MNGAVKLEIRKWLETLVHYIDMKKDNVTALLSVLHSEDFREHKPHVNDHVSFDISVRIYIQCSSTVCRNHVD